MRYLKLALNFMQDELQRKRIEALNSLSTFVMGLKGQLADDGGLGGKLDKADKTKIMAVVEDASRWIDEDGATASTEDIQERLEGTQLRATHSFRRVADMNDRYSKRR